MNNQTSAELLFESHSHQIDVSVIVLSFNQAKYILQNLRAFEEQSFKNFEIIVADDCSSDNSREVITSWSQATSVPHQILFNATNLGVCRNINNALAATNGRFISIIAADDWPETNFLSEMYRELNSAEKDVAFAFAEINEVDERCFTFFPKTDPGIEKVDSYEKFIYSHEQMFSRLLIANVVPAPAVLTRKEMILEFDQYDENLLFEDYDMWLKLSSKYKSLELKTKLVNYRILPDSLSRSAKWFSKIKKSETELLLKWLGVSYDNDLVIASRVRGLCFELFLNGDFQFARDKLKVIQKVSPSWKWKLFCYGLSNQYSALAIKRAFAVFRVGSK